MMAGLFLLFTVVLFLIVMNQRTWAIATTLLVLLLCLGMLIYHGSSDPLPIAL